MLFLRCLLLLFHIFVILVFAFQVISSFSDKMIWKFDTKIDNQPKPDLLFTENETNTEKLYNMPHYTKYYKDAFHRYVVNGKFGWSLFID